jgi:hypothetical protein
MNEDVVNDVNNIPIFNFISDYLQNAIVTCDESDDFQLTDTYNEFNFKIQVKDAYALKTNWYDKTKCKTYDTFIFSFYKGGGYLCIMSSKTGEILQLNDTPYSHRTIDRSFNGVDIGSFDFIKDREIKIGGIKYYTRDDLQDIPQTLSFYNIDTFDGGLYLFNVIFGYLTKSNLNIYDTHLVVTKEDDKLRCHIMSDCKNRIEKLKSECKTLELLYHRRVYTSDTNIVTKQIKTNLSQYLVKQHKEYLQHFDCNPLILSTFIKNNF